MDKIRRRRLVNDQQRLCQLARDSELFSFQALEGAPPERYLFEFDCITLIKPPGQEVQRVRGVVAQIYLPITYPRQDGPMVMVHHPEDIWHPNIRAETPGKGLVCAGAVIIGHFLDDFAFRLFSLFTYCNYTCDEHKSLNPAAAAWARHAEGFLPTDDRPLVGGKKA